MTSTLGTSSAEKLELEIEGMTCSGCAGKVEKALAGLGGVEANVNAMTWKNPQVMAALQTNSRRPGDAREHVPYRESKLTRLLQVSAEATGWGGRGERAPLRGMPVLQESASV